MTCMTLVTINLSLNSKFATNSKYSHKNLTKKFSYNCVKFYWLITNFESPTTLTQITPNMGGLFTLVFFVGLLSKPLEKNELG